MAWQTDRVLAGTPQQGNGGARGQPLASGPQMHPCLRGLCGSSPGKHASPAAGAERSLAGRGRRRDTAEAGALPASHLGEARWTERRQLPLEPTCRALRLLSSCSATRRASSQGVGPAWRRLPKLRGSGCPLDVPLLDSFAFPSQMWLVDLLHLALHAKVPLFKLLVWVPIS